MQTLFLDSLLPRAREGLLKAGLAEQEVSYYIDDVMKNRISSRQNGAAWQKSFMGKHGGGFQEMTHAYFVNQQKNIPVHKWRV